MTDIQCALGQSQLRKIDRFLARRQELVDLYHQHLQGIPDLVLPDVSANVIPAWHLYYIRLRNGEQRKAMYQELHEHGIGVQVHYLPVYWHPYYQNLGYKRGLCPVAENYYWRTLSLPIYPSMTENECHWVVENLKDCLLKGDRI